MRVPFSVAGALIGACLLAVPASAAPVAATKHSASPAHGAHVLLAQNRPAFTAPGPGQGGPHPGAGPRRGGGGGHSGPPPGGPRGGGHRGGGHHGGGGDNGAGIAAGVIGGLFLGAIIANEAQRHSAVDDCARRFRSYDRRSQTFVGRDGVRYSCP